MASEYRMNIKKINGYKRDGSEQAFHPTLGNDWVLQLSVAVRLIDLLSIIGTVHANQAYTVPVNGRKSINLTSTDVNVSLNTRRIPGLFSHPYPPTTAMHSWT